LQCQEGLQHQGKETNNERTSTQVSNDNGKKYAIVIIQSNSNETPKAREEANSLALGIDI
jgi:hypothetical protein